MPTPRHRAREFFHAVMGRVPGPSVIKALGDEIGQAEARGRREVLDLVRSTFGDDAALAVAQKIAERRSITPLDGAAQLADDVADERRATAPAGRG